MHAADADADADNYDDDDDDDDGAVLAWALRAPCILTSSRASRILRISDSR